MPQFPKSYQTTRLKKDSLTPQSPEGSTEQVNPNDITKSVKDVGFGECESNETDPTKTFDNSPESDS